jgi:membrane-bound lytic murein transglycosylase B
MGRGAGYLSEMRRGGWVADAYASVGNFLSEGGHERNEGWDICAKRAIL